MRPALCCTLGLLASGAIACGGTPPPTATPTPPQQETAPTAAPAAREAQDVREASAGERLVVQQLAQAAERIRGLRFERPVQVWVQTAAAMKQFVQEQLDEDELEKARRRYVLLDLLPPELNIRPLLLDVMEEQLVGYYDPKRGALAIRADVAESLEAPESMDEVLMFRAIILHELVHALQDQHFDLASRLEEKRSNDAAGAYDAVVEGDATLAMVAYVGEMAGATLDALLAQPRLLQQMLGEGMAADGPELGGAPTIVREPLLFSYREGALFVAELVRGGGWSAVNSALSKPPATTGDILWPQRYLQGKHTPPLKAERMGTLLAQSGLTLVEEEVLGPYELGLMLAEHGGEAAWARNWKGDRLWQLEVQGQPALAWLLTFDDPKVAGQVSQLLDAREGFELTRKGPRVLVLRGVPSSHARTLRRALGR